MSGRKSKRGRKYAPFDSIELGSKSVTYSKTLEHYSKCNDKDDPYTVEHFTRTSPGCSQCELIIHSRKQCDKKNCIDTDCCLTAVSVHCHQQGYNASVILPFAVQIDVAFSAIYMNCRYCHQSILTSSTLEYIDSNQHIINEHIHQHKLKDEVAVAIALGRTRKFGARSPIIMVDEYVLKKIFGL
jgi:hypothetical protein